MHVLSLLPGKSCSVEVSQVKRARSLRSKLGLLLNVPWSFGTRTIKISVLCRLLFRSPAEVSWGRVLEGRVELLSVGKAFLFGSSSCYTHTHTRGKEGCSVGLEENESPF